MANKLGLCMTGGGSRGAYQIGAAKALHDLGIFSQIKAFSGTSIGAANAAILATRSIEKAKDVWFTIPQKNIPRNTHQTASKGETRRRLLEIDRGIYSMDAFEDILIKAIDFEKLKSQEVYATVSRGGKKEEGLLELVKASYRHYIQKESEAVYLPLHGLSKKQVLKSIIASCSIPILFSPVTLDDFKYYDGGVFDNVPIKPLVDAGCDEIIILHLHKHYFYDPYEVAPDVKFHEVKHRGYLGGVLNFDYDHIMDLYKWGYEDCMAYFKNLAEESEEDDATFDD
ncbi:MAG: patatin-like phospholipase family protein [Bacillota bacterium]